MDTVCPGDQTPWTKHTTPTRRLVRLLKGLLHDLSVPSSSQANLLRSTRVAHAHQDAAALPSILPNGHLSWKVSGLGLTVV